MFRTEENRVGYSPAQLPVPSLRSGRALSVFSVFSLLSVLFLTTSVD
jgi:hypothetical protein